MCISLEYPLQSLHSGAPPSKRGKIKRLERRLLPALRDMKGSSVFTEPDPRFQTCGRWIPRDLRVLTRDVGIRTPLTTRQYLPTHSVHIICAILLEINVDGLGSYKYLKRC